MQISIDQVAELETRMAALEARQPTAILRGMIYGLTLTPGAGQITISVGKCRSSDDTADIEITTPLIKSLAAWSPGSTAGGRTSPLLPSQGYHVWLIYNPTTQVIDAVIDGSATNPAIPQGFTKKRRIGAFMVNSASEIRPFIQTNDMFTFLPAGRVVDLAAVTNAGPNSYIRQIGVPQGKKFWTRFQLLSSGGTAAGLYSAILDPDHGIPPAFGTSTDFAQIRRQNGTGNNIAMAEIWQWTDANRQVYTASNDTSDVITLTVLGWVDDRNAFE